MLTDSVDADVAIVGAGITGLTAAYLLAKSGRSVIVLEKNKIASGATAYTTGFLTQVIDTDLTDTETAWGVKTAGLVLDGHKAAIDTIEKIAVEEKIECEFVRCPNIVYATDSEEQFDGELDAGRRLGLEARIISDPTTLGFPAAQALEVSHQAKIHPVKYLRGLAEKAIEAGVRIFEHTNVIDVEGGRTLIAEHGLVNAGNILFATYVPFQQPPGLFFRKGTYITHIFELEMKENVLPVGIYEDTHNPYHYFRVDAIDGKTRVIVGGEDHRKDIPVPHRKSEQALEAFVETTFGHLKYRIVDRWSGPILEPSDGLPIIGPYEYDTTFYASGFSGNGLTYGTLSALMFRDHVEGRDNEWKPVFAPRRFPYMKGLMIKARDYTGELFGGAMKNMLRGPRKRATVKPVKSAPVLGRSS